MKGRFRELDGLRGIAALAVVFSHFTGGYNARYPNDAPAFYDIWWGAFGVSLFFMISGFVILMTAQAGGAKRFAISRLARLYPAYWAALAIAVIVGAVVKVPGTPVSPGVVVANLTMVQRWFFVDNVNDAFWTLAIEMQFYVLLFVLLLVTRARLTDSVMRWVAAAWLAGALVIAVWAYPQAHGVNPQFVPTIAKFIINLTMAEYGPLFCVGMLAYLTRRHGRFEKLLPAAVCAAVLAAGLLETWLHAVWVGCLSAVFLFIALRKRTGPLLWAPIQWLGKISYSLYVVHSILGYAVIRYTWPIVGRNVAIFVAIGVAMVVSWAVWAVFEARVSPWVRRKLTSAIASRSTVA